MIHTIIVEDDPMVTQINWQYLKHFRHFVVDAIFGNGITALEYLRVNTPDLIILDVYMPGMDGSTLLQRIRAENIKSAVIMVTAATEMSVVDDVLRLGIVDYLIKPYSFRRFEEALNKYLNKMNLLKYSTVADQELVDQLMNHQTVGTAADLPKGLNGKTLDIIYTYLKEAPQDRHTCESISSVTSLSKVTVRRYLNYLIETGRLSSSVDYETGGRPRILYSLKSQ